MFTHLNCHSNYSLLSGASTVEALLDRTKSLGMKALALTDTDGLYGAIPFYKAALARNIKPIIGVSLSDGCEDALLLASNGRGYSNICRAVTEKKLNHSFSLRDFLLNHRKGVIVISRSKNLLKNLRTGGNTQGLFVELRRASQKDNKNNSGLLEFSRDYEIPYVATNNIYFSGKSEYPIHRILSAIGERKTVKTLPPNMTVKRECYLKSIDEMQKLFKDLPKAVSNTHKISEMCEFKFDLSKMKFPKFKVPNGALSKNYLRELCVEGAKKRYGSLTDTVKKRLNHELTIICDLNLADYFLIVWDISNFAKKQGIPSVGRGSAADSLVSYVLYLTDVDPIKHNLFFERFLNRERKDAPDIDLDFCWRRRDKVVDYVYEKYGSDSTAMISTHVTFGGRSALREITKALGIPIEEVDKYIKKLPYFGGVEKIEAAKEKIPECRSIPTDKEPLKTIINIGRKIDGFPRHLSIHPGGIVISPAKMTDFIPLETASKGIVVTQFDMYPVEDMGLLKIDLLGQRGLSVIDDTIRDIGKNGTIKIDFERIDPGSDQKTKSLIRGGNTIGCFYIESPGMRLLLKKLKCDSFEGLVAASSIIRPGVASSGMMREYIERYNGVKPVKYLHPVMEEELKLTYGVMVYQEDVIRIANRLAGMSLGEADNLRRCMSKKRDWEAMEKYKNIFVKGAKNRGVDEKIAEEVWRQIESFAGYAFCKAHSASYAKISYQSAYLKAHYPAEFMANVIANGGGFYHTFEYVEEARRLGVRILLPDINKSGKYFWGSFDTIRIGLSQIKGIRTATLENIITEREDGFYVSLTDFLDRTNAGKKETENLIKCGAFDSLEFSRPELLWKLEMYFSSKKKSGQDGPTSMLLPLRYGEDRTKRIVPRIKDYSLRKKLKLERELLDFTAQAHPLDLFLSSRAKHSDPVNAGDCRLAYAPRNDKNDYSSLAIRHLSQIVNAVDIDQYVGKEIALVGWLVTSKRIKTKKGEQMRFLTLEDKTSSFEVTLFPKVYGEFGCELKGRGPYIVSGNVEDEFGGITLTANSFVSLRSIVLSSRRYKGDVGFL